MFKLFKGRKPLTDTELVSATAGIGLLSFAALAGFIIWLSGQRG